VKYLYSFRNAFYSTIAFRGNFLLRLATIFLQIMVAVFMWQAVFRFSSKGDIAGISQLQMTYYLIIVNLLSLIFSTSLIFKFSQLVRSGNLTILILRPVKLLIQAFFEYLGLSFPYLIIYGFVLVVSSETSSRSFAEILMTLALFAIIYITFFLLISAMSLVSFWLIQVWPMRPVINALFMLLGGQAFPLQVLPQSFHWLEYTPFALAGNQLALLSLGKVSSVQMLFIFLASISWSLVFLVLIKGLWHKGIHAYEGVGS